MELYTVLVWVPMAVIKHYHQKQLGGKGSFQLIVPHHSPPLEEVKAGNQNRN